MAISKLEIYDALKGLVDEVLTWHVLQCSPALKHAETVLEQCEKELQELEDDNQGIDPKELDIIVRGIHQ